MAHTHSRSSSHWLDAVIAGAQGILTASKQLILNFSNGGFCIQQEVKISTDLSSTLGLSDKEFCFVTLILTFAEHFSFKNFFTGILIIRFFFHLIHLLEQHYFRWRHFLSKLEKRWQVGGLTGLLESIFELALQGAQKRIT